MKKYLIMPVHYFEEIVLSCMMAYFVFATAAQVIARYVLKVSAPWAEETARYVFIWMTFLGAAYAAKTGSHIRVDILESALGRHGAAVRHGASLLFLVFLVIMAAAGVKICADMLARPQFSTVLHIPMVWVYAALPVGMTLTVVRTLQRMYREIRKKGAEEA